MRIIQVQNIKREITNSGQQGYHLCFDSQFEFFRGRNISYMLLGSLWLVCSFNFLLFFSRYACTALAFGQTGSGKTHTMTGPPQQVNSTSPVANWLPKWQNTTIIWNNPMRTVSSFLLLYVSNNMPLDC